MDLQPSARPRDHSLMWIALAAAALAILALLAPTGAE
jgi:hypothetical protein